MQVQVHGCELGQGARSHHDWQWILKFQTDLSRLRKLLGLALLADRSVNSQHWYKTKLYSSVFSIEQNLGPAYWLVTKQNKIKLHLFLFNVMYFF